MNIVFIPIRSGSKRIPNKNIKDLCGKPLYRWVVDELYTNSLIDKIVIATDVGYATDIAIDISQSRLDDKVEVYLREYRNSLDESQTEDVMLEYINKQEFEDEDKFILVQSTNPFLKNDYVDEAICLIEDGYASALSVVDQKRFCWFRSADKATPLNYNPHNRQMGDIDTRYYYIENGAFYISTVGSIKKDLCRLSDPVALVKMPDYSYTEIDTNDDWVYVDYLMQKYLLKNAKKH